MSERSIFSSRHTLPGSVFVLSIIFINAPEIQQILLNYSLDVQENIISIVALLLTSTLPFGFIISQPWHAYWRYVTNRRYQDENDAIIKEIPLGLSIADIPAEDWERRRTVYHYISSSCQEPIREYLYRRWDLINLIGSVEVSLLTSLILSIYFKGLFSLYSEIHQVSKLFSIIIFVVIIGIIVFLHFSIKDILREHQLMTLAVKQEVIEKLEKDKKSKDIESLVV